MSAVEFANVTDPLSLSSEHVSCIDEGGLGGGEVSMSDLKNSTGGQMQGNGRTLKDEGTVRYNPKGDLTASGGTISVDGTAVVAVGETKEGYYIVSVKPTKNNDAHSAFDVQGRKHINGDYVDECVE